MIFMQDMTHNILNEKIVLAISYAFDFAEKKGKCNYWKIEY